MTYLSVSAFAADFAHLSRDIRKVQDSGADFLHVDVMDGHFVPLIGFGTDSLSAITKRTNLPIDVHLMTYESARFIPQFLKFPLNSLLFHVEAETVPETLRLLGLIRESGVRCGLAVSPETAISALEGCLPLLDELLIMSTAPGQPGTAFDAGAFSRIRQAKEMAAGRNSALLISVDGGIEEKAAAECALCGADKVVMGRTFFGSTVPRLVAELVHSL